MQKNEIKSNYNLRPTKSKNPNVSRLTSFACVFAQSIEARC